MQVETRRNSSGQNPQMPSHDGVCSGGSDQGSGSYSAGSCTPAPGGKPFFSRLCLILDPGTERV